MLCRVMWLSLMFQSRNCEGDWIARGVEPGTSRILDQTHPDTQTWNRVGRATHSIGCVATACRFTARSIVAEMNYSLSHQVDMAAQFKALECLAERSRVTTLFMPLFFPVVQIPWEAFYLLFRISSCFVGLSLPMLPPIDAFTRQQEF